MVKLNGNQVKQGQFRNKDGYFRYLPHVSFPIFFIYGVNVITYYSILSFIPWRPLF